MGKSSRRSSRASRSKEERKRNFKEAATRHKYNQSICKSTNKITRNIIDNDSGQRRVFKNDSGSRRVFKTLGAANAHTTIPWMINNIRSGENELFTSIFVK